MRKILFVNACVRKQSRTLRLAKALLSKLDGEIQEINLERENLLPLNEENLKIRESFCQMQKFDDEMFQYAKDFASADEIVIAAPYWDLSFPSSLKVYFEHITVSGLTFAYEAGVPTGKCNAKSLHYVTTAGGPIILNLGYDYVEALAKNMYGINDCKFYKAENLDIIGNDADCIVEEAIAKINA